MKRQTETRVKKQKRCTWEAKGIFRLKDTPSKPKSGLMIRPETGTNFSESETTQSVQKVIKSNCATQIDRMLVDRTDQCDELRIEAAVGETEQHTANN